jgi:hypothetical protein
VSDDLVQFLRARLDEDGRIANAAPRGPWRMEGSGSIVDAEGGRVILSVGGALDGRTSRWPEGPVADAVTTWHPERALREIEAKQQVLHDLEQAEFTLSTAGPGTPPHDLMTGAVNTLRRVARRDVAVYRDHPDFDPAWLED